MSERDGGRERERGAWNNTIKLTIWLYCIGEDDLIEDGDAPYSPADEDTPYSPGEGEDEEMPPPPSPGDMEVSAELQRKMDELNRRIEEQKQQIQSIVAHSGNIAAVVSFQNIRVQFVLSNNKNFSE